MKSLAFLSLVLCAAASPAAKSKSSSTSKSSASSSSTHSSSTTSSASTSHTTISSSTSTTISSSSSSSSSATTQTCSPTSIPNRNWDLVGEKGLGWDYSTGSPDNGGLTVSIDESVGVKQCKAACAADPSCRTVTYWVYTDVEPIANCFFFAAPYNASYWFYEPEFQFPTNYTKVYEATNWHPPAELMPNGDFERGCLDPWVASFPGDLITAEAVRCNKHIKGDCLSGDYYLYINGTGNARRADGSVFGQPVVTQGRNYTFTAYVKGAVGPTQQQLSIFYDPNSDIPAYNGTGQWEKVEFNFVGVYGGDITITGDATKSGGPLDWKIDNCKVEEN